MTSSFAEYCEHLWRRWLHNALSVSAFVESKFQIDYLPEPYLIFGAARKPLHILTTNPGRGMPHQCRQVIRSGSSFVSPKDTYGQAASKLAEFYQTCLNGPARRRVDGILQLAEQSGHDGVLQFESCPFHSAQLPTKTKTKLLSHYEKSGCLKEYASVLREALRDVSVLSLSAVRPDESISIESIAKNPWLSWQASQIGLVAEQANLLPLTCKEAKITSALIYSQSRDLMKGFILMMGGNHLPAACHLEKVVELLGR